MQVIRQGFVKSNINVTPNNGSLYSEKETIKSNRGKDYQLNKYMSSSKECCGN